MALPREHIEEIELLLKFDLSSAQVGLKVHSNANPQMIAAARRLHDKGIEIGKREIDEVPIVEATPRYNAEDAALIGNDGQPDREAAE